jgi:hypothetical protein
MKKNKNISLARQGMNRDIASDSLKNQSYTFAKNMNVENDSGNLLKLKSEHSNLLASKFVDDYKVIGFESDINTGSTYFFLTNPTTGISEIGVIQNNANFDLMSDVEAECPDCEFKRILNEPLEGTTQTEYLTYTTLLSDCEENGYCLNFDIRYPIKKVIIKNEKSGIKIFFSDNYNPPRYINLNKLNDYLFTGVEVCNDDSNVADTCLACDKLRMFPIYQPIRLEPKEQVLGGNLPQAQYSFYIAYANKLGEEMSEYSSLTNPVSIFDPNNKILTNDEKDDPTSYAIKLNVSNIDPNFSYYKIVVSVSNIVDGGTRHYEVGTFPSTTEDILFTTTQDKKETTLGNILIPNPNIKLLEGLATSNNYLFGYGITKEKEWNLQPVVNLMGGFFKWQTHIGKEDLYEDGINVSLYKSFMRDEVYPLSIQFETDFGYRTARFPLIARPANVDDRTLIDNLDSQSIEAGFNQCTTNPRTEKWQFYNTASVIGTCSSEVTAGNFEIGVTYEITFVGDTDFVAIGASANTVGVTFVATGVGVGTGIAELAIPTNTVVEPITKICTIQNVAYSGSGSFLIFDVEEFPIGGDSISKLENFLNNILEEGVCSSYPFCADIYPIPADDCTPTFDNCDLPINPDQEFLTINTITNADITENYSTFPEEYGRIKTNGSCSVFELDNASIPVKDDSFDEDFLSDPVDTFAYIRSIQTDNISPYNADKLRLITDLTLPVSTQYVIDYEGSDTLANLQFTNFTTTCTKTENIDITLPGSNNNLVWTNTEFTDKVHRNSIWFEVDLSDIPENENNDKVFIIDVAEAIADRFNKKDSVSTSSLRLSVFDSKSGGTSKYCKFFTSTDGTQIEVSIDSANNISFQDEDGSTLVVNSITGRKIYFAIDAGIGYEINSVTNQVGATTQYVGLATYQCLGVGIKAQTIETIRVSYDSITFDKIQKYSADCYFEIPIVSECGIVPYKYGEFAYWESIIKYPDNNELYNSRLLSINTDDFSSVALAAEFEIKYATGVDEEGNLTLSADTDFTCQPIRHFKFPDNAVSPFMYQNEQSGFAKSIIYPIGVTVDENVVNDFLDIAVNNGLITQGQRNSIIGYEVFRGDRTLNKGVIAKGLAYDMYTYNEQEKDVLFSNFPYNSLGDNDLFLNDDRSNSITHPFDSDSNYNFTFHSPDTEFYKPSLPTEIKIEGYSFGKSKGVFDEVEGHAKYVILGLEARRLASTLATAEVAAEAIVASMEAFSNIKQDAGVSSTVFHGGWIGSPIIAGAIGIAGALFKYGRYKYQWLETFRNLGSPENFAYFYTSVGEYNYLKTLQSEGESVRSIFKANYIPSGRFTLINEVDGEKLNINNVDREASVFLTTGAGFPITYPAEYKDYDNQSTNTNLSSRFFQSTTLDCTKGRSKEFIKNIASPYIALKNYIPDQYGGIDNIDWLTTSYKGDLTTPDSSCLKIFGGDTFIARHTLKRKVPMFLSNAADLSDRTPFNYRAYSNIGEQPRFYANFLSPDEVTLDRGLPDISTEYEFDCLAGNRDFYIKQPSKFYLYYYGIPSFLTETTINTNYRTAKPEQKNLFYPLTGDYVEWTQENNVSIRERNEYFYSNIYSSNTRVSVGRTLPATYDRATYDSLYDAPNGVIYSLGDNNENELTEPWLVFRPLDKYEFSSSYGKLVELRGIETAQMLARFENQTAIFNAVDVLVDGITQDTADIGTGGVFARRPVTFADTDLGYAGSQTFDMVSCEYGHFFPDAKRGQIFQVPPGGKRLMEISANINEQPSGMKNWFKEHLPFKILNNIIEGYQDIDIDNPYNGIGITMGWDSRYKRVFITKKDYKPLQPLKWTCGGFSIADYSEIIAEYAIQGYKFEEEIDCTLRFSIVDGEDIFVSIPTVSLSDTDYFEDVSWTVAYSLTTQSWISYYDFKPNYYVNHNNYFQTGVNVTSDETEFGLWSHLLTNKSFGVFYGKKYEVGFEFPTINNFTSKELESLEIWTEALRYHNDYDFAYDRDVNFNKLVISNHRETTGNLRLVPQKTLSQQRNYPKTFGNYQEILMTNSQDRWKINYLYNRVSNEYLNQPIWNWDTNQINKTINDKLVKFKGKRVLERLKGNFFLNYLGYDLDTRFEVSFKWAVADENLT